MLFVSYGQLAPVVKQPLKGPFPHQGDPGQSSDGGLHEDDFFMADDHLEPLNSEQELGVGGRGESFVMMGMQKTRLSHVEHGLLMLCSRAPATAFHKAIIVIMKSWDDNNKSL